MSEKWKEDPTSGGKYTGKGVRIKAQNLMELDLTGKGPIAGGLICYVSKGGNNIARVYSMPDDYKAKIKELKEEGRFYVGYLLTFEEVERFGANNVTNEIEGNLIVKGPGSVN